ncbi:lytic transglycosylase domain-containing protein [Paraglaciecola polaris]|uniref:Soluble lytic murein transglycosylase n=1 Tax=Paraglaciecola polaris LMG 21857 TaxID=1129793 RepID=K6ZDF6_9ALTE|nr:lytic transglycosylase domain-containing protein [Paraglaciecola polaris]GAC34136.1 soluble lytic murein transglycosylase [Paraglaciecola polaris LMG 21857]
MLLLACFSSQATTTLSSAEQKLIHQREIFIEAESLAYKPQSAEYQALVAQLVDYPLLPYVQLKALMNSINRKNGPQIEAFLARYEGTPLDRSLRKAWLQYLAKHQRKSEFLADYKNTGSAELACNKIEFSLSDPALRDVALTEVPRLWVVGQSQPKACDHVFKVWQQAGLLSKDMVWQRLVLAATNGKHTLVPYLKKLLPDNERYLADLWLAVRRDASYVSRGSKFPHKQVDKESQILLYGLKRLAFSQPDLALKSWFALEKRFAFTLPQRRAMTERFAIALAVADHPQADLWLDKASADSYDIELFRWHLAHVLRLGNWQHALDLIETAPKGIAEDLAFQYWLGRTYEQLKAGDLAQQTFSKLADQRHYYGFMASGKLAQQPTLHDKTLNFSPQQLLEVSNMPQARRAYEFLQLDRSLSARREWYDLQQDLSEQQSLMAAVLADSWKWHDQAIFTFARVGYLDDLERRFPIAYDKTLINSANKHQIDPAWAFAIVRRESSFMADANSHAGARGLMQLMPGTANYLAKKKVGGRSLFDPEKNVEFGTQYMRYLMDKMDNNPVLATASYNAGWRKVLDWLPEQDAVPMDIWVETIPYKETRNYVKAVMAYKQIYAQRLGQPSQVFKELVDMQIVPLQQ